MIINTAMPIANEVLSERLVVAIFLPVVVEAVAVKVLLECSAVAAGNGEDEDDEGDGGLGHTLLYTNCSGAPLQAVADAALYVPLGYIQQVPEAYCELLGFRGLK